MNDVLTEDEKDIAAMSVTNGIHLLDHLVPAWRSIVDGDILDLTNGWDCMLGQLHNHLPHVGSTLSRDTPRDQSRLFLPYRQVVFALWGDTGSVDEQSARHGFTGYGRLGCARNEYFEYLRDLWRAELN